MLRHDKKEIRTRSNDCEIRLKQPQARYGTTGFYEPLVQFEIHQKSSSRPENVSGIHLK